MDSTRVRRPRFLHAPIAVSVAALMALLVSCGAPFEPPVNLPQPDAPLGFVALEMADTAPPRFSSRASSLVGQAAEWQGPIDDPAVTIEPSGASSLFALGDTVYVRREFLVTNGTDAPLENLVLLGYHREEFRASSAVSQPVNVAGRPVSDAIVRQITPTQALIYDGDAADPNLPLLGVAGRSDFIAFKETELPSLPLPSFVSTVFPYGFYVRSAEDPSVRTLPPGGQGRVHLAFAMLDTNLTAARLASFTWNAVVLSLDHVRVTQAWEENHPSGWATTLDRANNASADVVAAIGPGTRDTPAAICDAVLAIANVRIAGADASDPNYATLVPDDGTPEFQGCEGAP